MTQSPSFTITSFERAEQAAVDSLVFGRQMVSAKAGWDARIDVVAPDGRIAGTLHADRIDGEAAWSVSAVFSAGCSMPRFMNGLFSRCTIPQRPCDELTALLDERAGQ